MNTQLSSFTSFTCLFTSLFACILFVVSAKVSSDLYETLKPCIFVCSLDDYWLFFLEHKAAISQDVPEINRLHFAFS